MQANLSFIEYIDWTFFDSQNLPKDTKWENFITSALKVFNKKNAIRKIAPNIYLWFKTELINMCGITEILQLYLLRISYDIKKSNMETLRYMITNTDNPSKSMW